MLRTRLSTSMGATLALTLASTLPLSSQSTVVESEAESFRIVTVAEGLEHPWSIAFLPEGDILVTERPGRLRIIRDGQLQEEPISGVPEVHAMGQGGLLDVVLHPDFESNRVLYLSYAKGDGEGESTTAVSRARLDGNQLTDVEEIFEAQAWGERSGHYGSRLTFDQEGYLFVSIGDRQASPLGDQETREAHPAQDLSNHQGTILRLHDDGSVPSDNPFLDHDEALPEIWSYGHRSPQGFAIHPETGDVWETEHGPQGGDEVNLVRPGLNYGWPVIGYGVNYGGAVIHDDTHEEGMEQPVHHWTPSIATSGLMIYTGDQFPGWQESFFIGGLAGEQLARVAMNGREAEGEETLLEGYRIRDIQQGPDGFVYVAVDSRTGDTTPLIRLEPVQED